MNLKFCALSLCFTLATSVIVASSNASVFAESFIVDGSKKALNTNNNFRKVDGNPVMAIWDFSSTDRDQQFERIKGNRGGILLRHVSTGKCLNIHYLTNGGVVNTWSCNANDPDQNLNINSLGNGFVQIQRTGTNLCVDSPTRDQGGKVHVWTCDRNNPNQRFSGSIVSQPQPPKPPQPPSNSGQIILPFKSGQTWYVCQGYGGPISHQNSFALDLSIGPDFGSTACWAKDGKVSRSANQPLLAPAGGKIYHVNADLVCLSIDNNRSMLLGHIRDRVANGATVKQGDVLGYISAASKVNGGFSHIHLEARNSSNCKVGTSVPMTKANNFEVIGVGDIPAGQSHFKRALTRS